MDQAKQQVIDAINSNSNILVTVSTNPTVDELSAALGLTIMLDHMDKRATSVFSGSIPPAISFLEPDKTFDNSADSLRDFIIALDKEKADHLRYKVEGESVKIFITPYKTQLSQSDLQFSQGDYNVELIIALGVTDQAHLDKALESHGKILHDATVMTVTTGAAKSTLGSTDWHNENASSLSEMVASLNEGLKSEQPLLDQQVATALLTGIVSATARFSNDHTTTSVMTIAAQLMGAGANQQLIAAKLEEGHAVTPSSKTSGGGGTQANDSGTELTIDRTEQDKGNKQETKEQQFESQLAGVTGGSPTGTMADIEQQLQENGGILPPQTPETPPIPVNGESNPAYAPDAPAPPDGSGNGAPPPAEAPVEATPPPAAPEPESAPQPPQPEVPPPPPVSAVAVEPLSPPAAPMPDLPTASKDAGMPGFEPTGGEAAPALPQMQALAPAPEAPQEHPQIIQRHDTRAEAPSQDNALNSFQNGPEDGQPTINPFAEPTSSSEVSPVNPSTAPANVGGTPEGAALLNSSDETVAPPSPNTPAGVPDLPPLPPMPSDASNLPLPPPPPAPPADMGASLPPMPSGAVSGDVFGDSGVAPAPETAPEPAAAVPGQFKIPGQA